MGFSLFPSLFIRPTKISFAEQEPNETIELMLRQHWFTNVGWIIVSLVGLLAPFIFLNSYIDLSLFVPFTIPPEIVLAMVVLWYLFILTYIIEHFLFWYFNIYIVTNLHLMSISFSSLLYKEVTESQLGDIENIFTTMKGVASSLFNFGNVTIETAGKHRIIFASVPRPDFVADRIQDLSAATEGGGE